MKPITGLLSFPFLCMLAIPVQAQGTDPLIEQYCLDCHNLEDWAGSLALDTLDISQPVQDAETWEQVIRKLSAGMMPPAGEPRPDRQTVAGFVEALEQRLDSGSPDIIASPALHRLNRNEYANVIRDLLALEVDVSALLPQDNASEGFDNIASGLGFSPALIQGYTSAAMKVSRLAVGDLEAPEVSVTYSALLNLEQDSHLDGMPPGTRGGLSVTHFFPLDADYSFSVQNVGFGFNPNTRYLITLDGELIEPVNSRRFTLPVPAGEHTLTVSIVDTRHAEGVNEIYSEYGEDTGIGGVEINGPFNVTGTGNTASRERIFTCYPQSTDHELGCAHEIIFDLATMAFRSPVSEDDMVPLLDFYHRGRAEGSFETGIQQALSRILIDPRFLFRFEDEPEGLPPGSSYPITDMELASRLSFFLWSSIPDRQLLSLAEAGRLHEPEVLVSEVDRMLRHPKAGALTENFAGQWLFLRQLESVTPETEAFSENLRLAFIKETRLLFSGIIRDNRPITELLNADYTFVNERLASHYGITGIHGDYFRRIELPEDSPRRGLLGHASILTVTSTASRTSPVVRGSWILENLLHAPVPAPPPGVETNLDGDGSVELTNSVRERLEAHRQDPACNSCHSVIDPVGFALENFDMIGAWREYDGDSPVDATGTLVDGTMVTGPEDLRLALMERSELFVSTFVEKLLTYALGRHLEAADMRYIRDIMSQAETQDYRFAAVVRALVTSPVFLQRSAEDGDTMHAINSAGTTRGTD